MERTVRTAPVFWWAALLALAFVCAFAYGCGHDRDARCWPEGEEPGKYVCDTERGRVLVDQDSPEVQYGYEEDETAA